MAQTASEQEALSGYWVRLDQLTDAEWTDFYRRVRMALLRCPATQLRDLPDSRESYIDDFFTEKLFFKAQRATAGGIQTISGGALCFFFRNYLTDQLRGIKPTQEIGDAEAAPEMSVDCADPDEAVKGFLNQIGGHEALASSVDSFLAQLEAWALLMLRSHFCADDDEAIAMSELCKGIASYHYKAQKLGITVKKNTGDFLGYEHTRIGQWVKGMGVAIVPENYAVIVFLLGALCLEATAIVGEIVP